MSNLNSNGIYDLSFSEMNSVDGGLGQVAAYAIVTAVAAVAVAAFNAGYQVGKDLAAD